MQDKTYFFTENFFKINFIELNNLRNYNPIDNKIEFLFSKNFDFGEIKAYKIKYLNDDGESGEFKYCSKCHCKDDKYYSIKINKIK